MDLAPLLRRALERPGRSRQVLRIVRQQAGTRLAPVLPRDEPERLAQLHELQVLDTEADEDLDGIVQIAAQLCGTSMAALSFVDAERQWYKARVGIPVAQVPREHGFCGQAIVGQTRMLEIPDTSRVDGFDRQLHGPGALPVRFYAGVPLRTREGSAIGTLCVMDTVPRQLAEWQCAALEKLARTICSHLSLRRELRIATQTDRLTGLPNWLHFESQFETLRPRRGVVCFARLKAVSQINSAHGFRVADAMIQQTAARLRKLAEGDVLMGRIKRGLFILFFPQLEVESFARDKARVLAAALQEPYAVGPLTLVCPVNLGFAAYPRDGRTLDEVVNAADAALQLAIERDEPAAFFDRAVDAAASAHYRLEPQLRDALERNEFVNYYQPKVDIATGRIVGVEALIRWVHPERGLVHPSEFVPALEATGLIREVGRHILLRAVADWQRWRSAGLPAPRVAVNVAAAQLRHGELIAHLREALCAIGNHAGALGIEVTESVLIGDMERAVELLRQVRALGVPVAIDDFGTGYSSLSYIVTLPIDEVKIDRSFVRRIATDPAYRGLVAACVGLARNLNLKVIAEGVETREQADELLALRCEQAQGFLYSAPVPADELAVLLRRGAPLG
ncbi:MAG TPA: sensor domain-containing phosphodiesterase [Ramlibacter sp.]|jgi:predicted signal transduction protein with EAL and GGDEF domain|uniref:putative bifunctional diguanylate cyclase/phosphodiesterase n=1 Tax=Ramlibacter sp. TaxID=1917967 RepID=UPI002D54E06E|nr:sensor domain-containing phosphodiesterase [Ramlibacter sp.]HZY19974.1 sensor domain-containing phosphodiesterase [Ramlibacter sp.]